MLKKYRDFRFAACKLNTGFYVRSAGEFRLVNNGRELPKKADFPEIFWCIEGCGSFYYEGKYHLLQPGQVWYYPPGALHDVGCSGKYFRYCWMAWDGPDAAVIFNGLNLKPGINLSGACPHDLFNKLILSIEKNTVEAQKNSLGTGFEILLNAAFASNRNIDKYEHMEHVKTVIDDNFADQGLNVQRVADLLQMNRSVMSRMFSAAYKITIVEYIAGLRLQKAMKMIRETDVPLNKIAEKCGYSCHNYFSKVIRRHTGHTPGELRKM